MMLVISVLLSLLLLVVIILATTLLKQHHKLHDYARRQKENNKALTEANRQLQLSIEANKETNRHLYEANVVKENCIATFFALCTHYIESVNHLARRRRKRLPCRSSTGSSTTCFLPSIPLSSRSSTSS